MDPTRRYHLTSGIQRRAPARAPWPRRLLGAAGRVGAVAIAASVVGLPLAFFAAPVPAGADGVTLCLPGVGPVQQFADGLSGELQEIVRIHELMHVQQCRSMGAAAWYLAYGSREGRMRLEAEAYCAEVQFLARRGGDPEALVESRARILHAGYGNQGVLSLDEIRALVRQGCHLPLDERRPTGEASPRE